MISQGQEYVDNPQIEIYKFELQVFIFAFEISIIIQHH